MFTSNKDELPSKGEIYVYSKPRGSRWASGRLATSLDDYPVLLPAKYYHSIIRDHGKCGGGNEFAGNSSKVGK